MIYWLYTQITLNNTYRVFKLVRLLKVLTSITDILLPSKCLKIVNLYIQVTQYITSKVSTPFQPINNLNITKTCCFFLFF